MSRYFIDTDDGDMMVRDEEGMLLDSDEVARDYAQDVLPDMARGQMPNGNRHTFVAAVRNAAGEVIYRVSLTLDGEWVKGPRPSGY